jgi:hypothetical protein
VTTTAVAADRGTTLRADLADAARVLAILTVVGAACGAFVVGVLARLAMFLLAVLNPEATGRISDDGFRMGQFTLSGSAQLMASGLQFGIIGVAFYVAVRGLMIGPPWFRLVSVSLGPAVVVGAMLVHTDGVDFQVLQPVWLAVALFIALPGVFVALLHLLGEGAVRRWQPPRAVVVLGLLPWVLLFPVTVLMIAVFLGLRALRHRSAWPAWILRAGLAAVFVWAVLDLRADLIALA